MIQRSITSFFLFLFSWNSLGASRDSFYMIFMSDTQYPWACPVRNPDKIDCSDKGKATLDALEQMKWVREKVMKLKGQVKGVVINGDLTAFGHEEEFKAFQALWYAPLLHMGLRVYPGLGNHDFQNNVNDCYNNNCASRMYNFMRDFVLMQAPVLTSFDYRPSKVYYKFPANRRDHKGSLSYSWEVGDVHFVQLHNYPGYQTEWSSWNPGHILRDHYKVETSYAWLRKDLEGAKKRRKRIVLSMHDADAGLFSPKFKAIARDFNISAIFAGHYHQYVGKKDFPQAKNTPVYLAGASVYRSALVVKFEGGKKMIVEAYRGKGHGQEEAETASTKYFENPLLLP